LKEGLERFPESAILNCEYAIFLQNTGKTVEAEAFYKRSLGLDPLRQFTLMNYAVFLETRRHDFDAAEEHYLKAAESSPPNARALAMYGAFLHDKRGDEEKALRYLKRAVEVSPPDSIARVRYAHFEEAVGNKTAAEKLILEAIAVVPDDADIQRSAAIFYERRGDNGAAEKYYLQAIDLAPNDALGRAAYGSFLTYHVARYDDAEEQIKKALEINPRYPYAVKLYADFLEQVRHDKKTAAEYRDRLK
jgi:Tfp pilus assembly protein PilF